MEERQMSYGGTEIRPKTTRWSHGSTFQVTLLRDIGGASEDGQQLQMREQASKNQNAVSEVHDIEKPALMTHTKVREGAIGKLRKKWKEDE